MNLYKEQRPKLKRNILSWRFLQTGWAMLRYLPKLLTTPKINGLNFYKPSSIKSFVSRVEALNPDTKRVWGTMKPEQMLHHLNLAVGGALGFYELPDESYFLSRTLFRLILVDWFNEQPIGLRLPLNFIIKPQEQFDFVYEQKQLVLIILTAGQTRSAEDWGPHPMFGKMSYEEWGKLLTMHIDYHLRQFGL